MKKILNLSKKIIIVFLFIFIILLMKNTNLLVNTYSFALDGIDEINKIDEIDEIKGDINKYGIKTFIENSKKYVSDLNIDISTIFNNILKEKFDNKKVFEIILNIFDKNSKDIVYSISGIVVIILINSLLKAISENLGNDSVSKIAEYVQYILIVTILMKNFSEIIAEMKDAILNLTAFSNSLIPLMCTLIISTGNIVTSSIVEPILLLIISFIGNFVVNVVIPMILVSVSLGIISKIGTNIQVDKI